MNPAFGLWTIGYEGCAIGNVVDTLKGMGIGLLLDVRAVAHSRKPGFSKRQLAASLDERGMGYAHLRALGTPKPGRVAARAGRIGEMRAIYAAHLENAAAQSQLAEAVELARNRPCCLLCFEADHHSCHRDILAPLVCDMIGGPVHHLRCLSPTPAAPD